MEDGNQNLTPSQKLLLKQHYRFGHTNIPFIQFLFKILPEVFGGNKFQSASRCDIPICEIYQYVKAHRRKLQGKTSRSDIKSEGAVKSSHLRPGEAISVDHFESWLKGRTYNSFERNISDQYVGGCIFVDHMSARIKVEH